ncbi:MAG: hypothetical protein AABO58_09380 [Acidobacteriota bacterium]
MSLRIFHIIFIIASFGLSLFVALWGFREWSATRSSAALTLAVVFVVSAAALVGYGMVAVRKLRNL